MLSYIGPLDEPPPPARARGRLLRASLGTALRSSRHKHVLSNKPGLRAHGLPQLRSQPSSPRPYRHSPLGGFRRVRSQSSLADGLDPPHGVLREEEEEEEQQGQGEEAQGTGQLVLPGRPPGLGRVSFAAAAPASEAAWGDPCVAPPSEPM